MRLEKLDSLSLLWGIPSKEGLKKIKKTNSVLIPEMRPYILGLKVAEGLNKEVVKPIKDKILITAHNTYLGFLEKEDILVIDKEGNVLEGNKNPLQN